MKKLLIALFVAMPLFAQEEPLAEHKRLAELTGSWKVVQKMWFDPAGAAKVSTGSGTGRMILGGRFLQLDANVKGDLAQESLTLLGFDRRTSDYTLVGYDDMGTYYITAAGKYDDAQKGVVLDGHYAQPPSGTDQKYRFVWTHPSANEHLLELYFFMNGKEVRVAETRLTR